MKRKTWKGGPRSRRSYVMDYHRKAKDEKPSKRGRVRPHYRKKPKRAGYTKVRPHKRRIKRR